MCIRDRYGISHPRFEKCTISVNTNDLGAGVLCHNRVALTLEDCTVASNVGAGIVARRWSSLDVTECRVASNSGGGIKIQDYAYGSVTDSEVTGNSGLSGAGMACLDHSQLDVSGTTIFDNTTTGNGAGLFCDLGSRASVQNCQFSSNYAGADGGGICCLNSSLFAYPVSYTHLRAHET